MTKQQAIESALRELVRLKRLKDKRYALADVNCTEETRKAVSAATQEHDEKKDAAWAAAEAALSLPDEPTPPPCKHDQGSGVIDSSGNGEFTCHKCGHVQKFGRGLSENREAPR